MINVKSRNDATPTLPHALRLEIGTGMGEQMLSREYYYLGTQLPIDRFLTFYYGHPGFQINNMLVILSVQVFVITSMWPLLFHSLCYRFTELLCFAMFSAVHRHLEFKLEDLSIYGFGSIFGWSSRVL
jgi:hypothetical protein